MKKTLEALKNYHAEEPIISVVLFVLISLLILITIASTILIIEGAKIMKEAPCSTFDSYPINQAPVRCVNHLLDNNKIEK